jgi:hypothetical protein
MERLLKIPNVWVISESVKPMDQPILNKHRMIYLLMNIAVAIVCFRTLFAGLFFGSCSFLASFLLLNDDYIGGEADNESLYS